MRERDTNTGKFVCVGERSPRKQTGQSLESQLNEAMQQAAALSVSDQRDDYTLGLIRLVSTRIKILDRRCTQSLRKRLNAALTENRKLRIENEKLKTQLVGVRPDDLKATADIAQAKEALARFRATQVQETQQ